MFTSLDKILEDNGITTLDVTAFEYQRIKHAMEIASEQAFNAARAYKRNAVNAGEQIEIAEPEKKHIYKRFIDFKMDKL